MLSEIIKYLISRKRSRRLLGSQEPLLESVAKLSNTDFQNQDCRLI
jgi:hypothetical protein